MNHKMKVFKGVFAPTRMQILTRNSRANFSSNIINFEYLPIIKNNSSY